MFKRLALAGILCIGLMAIWGADANAYPPSLSGWSFKPGSVDATTFWKGVSNYDLKPSHVVIRLSNISVLLYEINHGGNQGGVGTPFQLAVGTTLTGTQMMDPFAKNGNFTSLIVFPDSMFFNAIDQTGAGWLALLSSLQNKNWSPDPNHVDVTHFRAVIQGFTDVSNTCENFYYLDHATAVDPRCYPFSLPDLSAQAVRYEEQVVQETVDCDLGSGVYNCTTVSIFDYSKKNPDDIGPTP